jgi:pimeloyl-ACP methyl ester carboxylesterase
MTAGFNYYRALRVDIPYVKALEATKITVPVLTIAGRHGVGDGLHTALLPTADNLVGLIAENSGHFVAEEDPEFFCTTLERFLSA